MSGKNLVQQKRASGVAPARPPGRGFGGFLFTAICIFVIGGSAFYAATHLIGARAPAAASTVAPAEVSLFAEVVPDANTWTAEDEAYCSTLAADAAAKDEADIAREQQEQFAIMPSTSGGLAERGAYMVCQMTAKVARFCDPDARQELALMIDEYALKLDAASALFRTSVASVNSPLISIAAGGKDIPGTSIITDGLQRSFERMKAIHVEITNTFRELIKAGVIGPEDFDIFLGYGVRPTIEAMIGNTRATYSICG